MSIWSWLRLKKVDGKLPAMADYIESGCPACGSRRALSWRRDLRIGHIYGCRRCDAAWYLWTELPFREPLDPGALPLIEAWNTAPVTLDAEMRATLKSIGASPTHPTPRNRETPCAVTTVSGEYFPCAIVRQQNYAPYWVRGEEWRLATEIAKLAPSPYALPFEVRLSTSDAPEAYKNYRPWLIVMPDGRFFTGDGPEVFMVHPDYDATTARMAGLDDLPPGQTADYVPQPETVVRFVADPWERLERRQPAGAKS